MATQIKILFSLLFLAGPIMANTTIFTAFKSGKDYTHRLQVSLIHDNSVEIKNNSNFYFDRFATVRMGTWTISKADAAKYIDFLKSLDRTSFEAMSDLKPHEISLSVYEKRRRLTDQETSVLFLMLSDLLNSPNAVLKSGFVFDKKTNKILESKNLLELVNPNCNFSDKCTFGSYGLIYSNN